MISNPNHGCTLKSASSEPQPPRNQVRKKKVSKNGFDQLDCSTPNRDSLPDYPGPSYNPDQV